MEADTALARAEPISVPARALAYGAPRVGALRAVATVRRLAPLSVKARWRLAVHQVVLKASRA
jgi:hypothetical protein